MTATTAVQRPRRRVLFRLLRWMAVILLLVLALPYLIAPFYRFIDPVSTVMLWRWLTGARVERSWVPIGQMAPVAAALGDRLRGRAVLRPSRHRLARPARGIPRKPTI